MKIRIFCLLLLCCANLVFAQPAHKCQPENILASAPTSRYVNNADGTITDLQTDLMWKQCVEGLHGNECSEGEALALNWAEALLYLPGHNQTSPLSHSDWRLPNIRELSTLVETQCVQPAINLEVFPNTPAVHVWTSSPYHFYTHYSWYVNFAQGQPTYDERIRDKGLRLVRDLN